jgi:hypothetical protein
MSARRQAISPNIDLRATCAQLNAQKLVNPSDAPHGQSRNRAAGDWLTAIARGLFFAIAVSGWQKRASRAANAYVRWLSFVRYYSQ